MFIITHYCKKIVFMLIMATSLMVPAASSMNNKEKEFITLILNLDCSFKTKTDALELIDKINKIQSHINNNFRYQEKFENLYKDLELLVELLGEIAFPNACQEKTEQGLRTASILSLLEVIKKFKTNLKTTGNQQQNNSNEPTLEIESNLQLLRETIIYNNDLQPLIELLCEMPQEDNEADEIKTIRRLIEQDTSIEEIRRILVLDIKQNSNSNSNSNNNNKEEKEEEKCLICLDNDAKDFFVLTPCIHKFHENCLKQALVIKKECPICRERTSSEDLVKVNYGNNRQKPKRKREVESDHPYNNSNSKIDDDEILSIQETEKVVIDLENSFENNRVQATCVVCLEQFPSNNAIEYCPSCAKTYRSEIKHRKQNPHEHTLTDLIEKTMTSRFQTPEEIMMLLSILNKILRHVEDHEEIINKFATLPLTIQKFIDVVEKIIKENYYPNNQQQRTTEIENQMKFLENFITTLKEKNRNHNN